MSLPNGYRIAHFPDNTTVLYSPRKKKELDEDQWGVKHWVDGFDRSPICRFPTFDSKSNDAVAWVTVCYIAELDAKAHATKDPHLKKMYMRLLARAINTGKSPLPARMLEKEAA